MALGALNIFNTAQTGNRARARQPLSRTKSIFTSRGVCLSHPVASVFREGKPALDSMEMCL